MKSKDQIFLENAYSKILLENEKFQPHDPEMQELSKPQLGEVYPEDESINDNLEPNNDFENVTEEILNNGPLVFKKLLEVKTNNKVSEYVDYLNSQENWTAKDKLIKLLFSSFDPSEAIYK